MQNIRFRGLALAATGAVAVLATGSASAQNVSVTLNGSPVSLVPAPISRAGRVFVPLRGVFEKLGASVVYAGGTINAQGNGRSVALRIGSTQATVDGQAQMLDVAPFIVGASTYVPLRFVSQALGATVNYDGSNHVVALTRDGAANMPVATLTPQPAAGQAAKSALTLSEVRPGRNASVESRRPSVEALFAGAQADPNSIRISLDNLDVTNSASRSPSGIVYSPPSALQSGVHTVRVMGHDSQGMPFDRSWRFTSGTSSVTNVIDGVRPTQGATVSDQFTVSGHTVPNARVIVQVGAVQQQTAQNVIGQILGIGGGNGNASSTFRSEVNADANGMFSTSVTLNAQSGQQLVLVIDSTEPSSQAAAPRQTRQLVVQ